MEVSSRETRPTSHRTRTPGPDSPHVPRESALGRPRILSELLLLGYEAAERSVAKYMVRTRKPPSQTWRTFLTNHVPDIAACDFFTVPTVTFRVLYVFIVLRHDRRRVVHFNVTEHPYAEWAAQQIIESFPFEEAPRFLLRDRDGIYGGLSKTRVEGMGIEEVPIAPRSPWQNPDHADVLMRISLRSSALSCRARSSSAFSRMRELTLLAAQPRV